MIRRLLVFVTFAIACVAQAQTIQPGGTWTVHDANNKVVGQWIGYYHVSTVVNGYVVGLGVGRNALSSDSVLYYDQLNCQGNAFFSVNTTAALDTPATIIPSGTILIGPLSQQSVPVAAKSNYAMGFGCGNANTAITGVPPQTGPNVKQEFTPPFTVTQGAAAPMLNPGVLAALAGVIALVALLYLRRASV